MKARSLFALALVASASALSALVACASDEMDSSLGPEGSSSSLPGEGGGADASSDGALEEGEPCSPEALCPGGPFDPSTIGGALDLRTRITAIRGRSASDVWAVGAGGTIVHFDGTSWSRSETGTIETMNAIWLRENEEIALVSLAAMYTRGLPLPDGGNAPPSAGGWSEGTLFEFGPSAAVTSTWTAPGAPWLWCSSPAQNGSTGLWRLHVDPASQSLDIANPFGDDVCATLPCAWMTSVHGTSGDDLWAVGYSGTTYRITNAQGDAPVITPFDSKTWAGLNGVWAASEKDAWSVGGAGVIRHYTGQPTSWDVVDDVPTTGNLNAIWGTSSTDVWAVGNDAVVLHYDGKGWSLMKVAGLGVSRPNLYTVWASSPGHVWIGGDGVILSVGGKP